jgi:hypothetical protein
MNRMQRSITKYDALFFFGTLTAIIINHYVLYLEKELFLGLVLVGLAFEILNRSFWTYSEVFKQSLFTIEGSAVSISAAFFWAAFLVICMNVSCMVLRYVHFTNDLFWIPVIVVGVIGNILETVCCVWGMFVYNQSWVTRLVFFREDVYLWHVPVLIRVGYFISFGPLCAIIMHYCI